MTRDEFDRIRLRLMFSGVCPACGSPIDLDSLRELRLACANPTCNFAYQAALNERFELPVPEEDRPSPARLPLRES
ncbi:MAG: hypothetical protein ABJC61_05280 [Acidobacteriota bacterium]